MVTMVRGRAYRNQPKRRIIARINPQPKLARMVCLLSAWEAEALERFGIAQPCFGAGCRHHHHSREDISQMVIEGVLRWVAGSRNVAAWKEARHLAIRPSGPVTCLQLVPIGR